MCSIRNVTEVEIARMRARIAKLLRTNACLDIKFRVENINIQRYQYSYTAHLIAQNRVKLVFGKRNGYSRWTHELSFTGPDVSDATIVHVCTQVLINATHKGAMIRTGARKLAAYLAETIWALNANREVTLDIPNLRLTARRLAREAIDHARFQAAGSYEVCENDQLFAEAILKSSPQRIQVDTAEVQTGLGDGRM